MHQSEYLLKLSVVSALPALALKSSGSGDLGALQQLLVDQPNIPRDEETQNIEDWIQARKNEIFRLNIVDDALGLEEEGVMKRNMERALLIQDSKMLHVSMHQKAKLKWLKAGDANSTTFHRYINGRRNEIQGMAIRGAWSRDVKEKRIYQKRFRRKTSRALGQDAS